MREVRYGLLYTHFIELVYFLGGVGIKNYIFPSEATQFEAVSPLRNTFLFKYHYGENSVATR